MHARRAHSVHSVGSGACAAARKLPCVTFARRAEMGMHAASLCPAQRRVVLHSTSVGSCHGQRW